MVLLPIQVVALAEREVRTFLLAIILYWSSKNETGLMFTLPLFWINTRQLTFSPPVSWAGGGLAQVAQWPFGPEAESGLRIFWI